MKTVKQPRPSGSPMGAGPRDKDPHLAALTRTNHDLRSPLSVILGVFELLEETASLRESELRYVRLGSEAAAELLNQADALRLYSALARNLVTLELGRVDLGALARDRLAQAFAKRNVQIADAGGPVHVLADAGYVGVALTSLGKHLADHFHEPEPGAAAFEIRTERKDAATILLSVQTTAPADPLEAAPAPMPGESALAVVNAVRLIELMRGRVSMNADQGFMHLELPSAGSR